MQGGTNHMNGGGVRELPSGGPPLGGGGGPLIFPHGPLMIPPGLPLPIGAPFPGAGPPPLLPGAFALHQAAVAGAAAGAAAAAEEAREARERAMMNAVNNDGMGGPPGGPPMGLCHRGARGGPPRGKRHGMERVSHSWRRQPHDDQALSAAGSASVSRSHKARGGEWRGRGAPHPGGGAAARWRVAETGGSSSGAPTTKKRQRLGGRGGPAQQTSDSELSLMSVASDEQQQNRRSPSVEFVPRQKPLSGEAPPPCSAPQADNAGELSAVLTPMSSLSRSSRNSSISRGSSPCEQQFQAARSRAPMDVVGGAQAGGSIGQPGAGQNDSMPEWPPGLGGPVVTSSRLPPPDYSRARSPPPPPGFNADNAATSAQHQAGPQHNAAKRSPPKRSGRFLFDLWVPTTFHPLGKDAIKAVLGVRGSTHKEMERVAGAHVQIYGKQLNRNTKKHEYDEFRDNQPLHLVVTSDRLKNPNPTPDEQLQMVHRLQNMLEGLVRENWPPVAPHPPHSFFEKQQCLGPSTGPLVEVEPLTGTCRVAQQPSNTPSPVSALRLGGAPPAAEEVLHAGAAAPLQQRHIEGGPPPIHREEQGQAGQARPPPGVAPHLASVSQPQILRMPPTDVAQQPTQPPAAPWQQQQPGGGAPQPASVASNDSATTEIRFRGDPSLLLDLPPPLCLLMLTLQGLHALLAEEGPCSLSALPSRFVQRWEVPFKYYKAEYGLDASCPLSWSDSLLAFVEQFPEVIRVADADAAWAQGPAADTKTPTVACVDPPQFRAVAARMRQLRTA
ncbi:hypothetical protein Emed_003722 [Eimeria media]